MFWVLFESMFSCYKFYSNWQGHFMYKHGKWKQLPVVLKNPYIYQLTAIQKKICLVELNSRTWKKNAFYWLSNCVQFLASSLVGYLTRWTFNAMGESWMKCELRGKSGNKKQQQKLLFPERGALLICTWLPYLFAPSS